MSYKIKNHQKVTSCPMTYVISDKFLEQNSFFTSQISQQQFGGRLNLHRGSDSYVIGTIHHRFNTILIIFNPLPKSLINTTSAGLDVPWHPMFTILPNFPMIWSTKTAPFAAITHDSKPFNWVQSSPKVTHLRVNGLGDWCCQWGYQLAPLPLN